MKIAYITNARIPTEKAHGYQICKMCEEFSNLGCEVELILPNRKNFIQETAYKFYGIKNNFEIIYLKSFDFIKLDKIIGGRFACYLQEIFFLFKLFFLKLDKGTTVYTRSPEIAWLFKAKKYKTVYEMHYWPEKNNILFKLLIKNVDDFIVLTAGLKNILIKNSIENKKISVSPDGVDLQLFDIAISKNEARQRLNLPKDKFILGYSGQFKTMGEGKGIEIIIEAIKKLNDENIIFFAIGGTKNDIGYYQNIFKSNCLSQSIILKERLPRNLVAVFQKACDVLLMPFPKTKHYELFMSPLKMFEYMAAKRPIIASELQSVKEALNNDNSILIKPDNCESLVQAIKRITDNPDEAKTIANNSYIDAKKYTWGNRAGAILDFIKDNAIY